MINKNQNIQQIKAILSDEIEKMANMPWEDYFVKEEEFSDEEADDYNTVNNPFVPNVPKNNWVKEEAQKQALFKSKENNYKKAFATLREKKQSDLINALLVNDTKRADEILNKKTIGFLLDKSIVKLLSEKMNTFFDSKDNESTKVVKSRIYDFLWNASLKEVVIAIKNETLNGKKNDDDEDEDEEYNVFDKWGNKHTSAKTSKISNEDNLKNFLIKEFNSIQSIVDVATVIKELMLSKDKFNNELNESDFMLNIQSVIDSEISSIKKLPQEVTEKIQMFSQSFIFKILDGDIDEKHIKPIFTKLYKTKENKEEIEQVYSFRIKREDLILIQLGYTLRSGKLLNKEKKINFELFSKKDIQVENAYNFLIKLFKDSKTCIAVSNKNEEIAFHTTDKAELCFFKKVLETIFGNEELNGEMVNLRSITTQDLEAIKLNAMLETNLKVQDGDVGKIKYKI